MNIQTSIISLIILFSTTKQQLNCSDYKIIRSRSLYSLWKISQNSFTWMCFKFECSLFLINPRLQLQRNMTNYYISISYYIICSVDRNINNIFPLKYLFCRYIIMITYVSSGNRLLKLLYLLIFNPPIQISTIFVCRLR